MLLPVLAFGPMCMAVLSYLIGRRSKRARNIFVGCVGVLVFLGTLPLWRGETAFTWEGFCGFGLHFKADGFRSLYASVAAFMWMMSGLFSPEYFAHYHNRNRYYLFNLMTLGATLGVFYSDDLYTTLIFFEVMSLTSFTWVAQEETEGALKAAGTYLAVAVIGGLVTLMGLFLLWHELGTLSFDGIRSAIALTGNERPVLVAAAWLTLFGFAAKAGMFPLHIWLPKAHPVAPAPASSLLSGILTKSGVFGVIVVGFKLMPGNASFAKLLLVFAVITMFLGALLALFSVDLKRTLACSSMSQIGFITVGLSFALLLGEEGITAAYGSILHMVNHSLIKLCLFLCAGAVYMNAHTLDLNRLKGFGRGKPVLHFAFLSGALSIACIPPLGSGFNSKSLIHEGILEYIEVLKEHGAVWMPYKALEILFLISGGLTIAYMTKLYICLFWDKPAKAAKGKHGHEHEEKKTYMTPLSAGVLIVCGAILPLLGLFGMQLMSPLAQRSMAFMGLGAPEHAIRYFTAENFKGAAESLLIGAAVYLLIVRRLLMKDGEYIDRWPAWLDLERLYRFVLLRLLPGVTGAVCGFIAGIPDSRFVHVVLPACITALTRFIGEIPERIVMLLRGTALRKLTPKEKPPVGSRFTWRLGRALDGFARALNATFLRRRHMRTDFEYVLDASVSEFRAAAGNVLSSMSFGLLLLCIGLFITCLYLLLFA